MTQINSAMTTRGRKESSPLPAPPPELTAIMHTGQHPLGRLCEVAASTLSPVLPASSHLKCKNVRRCPTKLSKSLQPNRSSLRLDHHRISARALRATSPRLH